jgi:hypothetical protein
MMGPACTPSYLGDRGKRIEGKVRRPYLENRKIQTKGSSVRALAK